MLRSECGALTAHVERAAAAEPWPQCPRVHVELRCPLPTQTLEVSGSGKNCGGRRAAKGPAAGPGGKHAVSP